MSATAHFNGFNNDLRWKEGGPRQILRKLLLGFCAVWVFGCQPQPKKKQPAMKTEATSLQVVGAIRDVMWKGELGSKIDLDTLANKKGLYGLGPEINLTGELLINNGKRYVSKVTSDSTMVVEERTDLSAPFFVYTHVLDWHTMALPNEVKSIQDLEAFIIEATKANDRPQVFRLEGTIAKADIHIQNLPQGTSVSSPAEAHQGQTSYALEDEEVEIIGFFSKEHQGVFTHHDSFLHMHLITADAQKMGHLDSVEIKEMTLYLPD